MFRVTDIKVFTQLPAHCTDFLSKVFNPFCVSIQGFPYRCANCKCCYSVLSISTLNTKLKKRAMHLINYVTDKDNCEYDINDQETPRALGKVFYVMINFTDPILSTLSIYRPMLLISSTAFLRQSLGTAEIKTGQVLYYFFGKEYHAITCTVELNSSLRTIVM